MVRPLEERLAKQEKVNEDMGRQPKTLLEELEILRENAGRQDFPPLPVHSGQVHQHNETLATPRLEGAVEDKRESVEEEEIQLMCADARRVIGLTPIEPRMLELQMQSYGAKDMEEAMMMEVKSYLKCEMKVRPSEIEKLDIVRVFHPAKENWNVLYLELGSEHQVDSLLYHTRVMEKRDHRVIRWIPSKMYQRFSAL